VNETEYVMNSMRERESEREREIDREKEEILGEQRKGESIEECEIEGECLCERETHTSTKGETCGERERMRIEGWL
jgi:hypothetical protein